MDDITTDIRRSSDPDSCPNTGAEVQRGIPVLPARRIKNTPAWSPVPTSHVTVHNNGYGNSS